MKLPTVSETSVTVGAKPSVRTESPALIGRSAELAANEIISLDQVSVQYRVPSEKIGTLKEFAIRYLQRRIHFNTFLALKNVDLKISKGEVFGIIGRNGAGKSTMLKVIAKVLKPTKGRVIVRGRIAPLLELGAGFHPELSGRENVFLNGALLGYSQKEMLACFDQIVEFSELKDFIEAPIRTYSSGMYARLGFAVATAHVPEVLIVDEILSVGDEAFQEKCNARITEYQKMGTTILMVSHALPKVRELCTRVAWVNHGVIQMVGDPAVVVKAYQTHPGSFAEHPIGVAEG